MAAVDLSELGRDLQAVGVAPDDYELPGATRPGREGALFLAHEDGQWLVGSLDRGRHVVSSVWQDEDTACTEVYGRLTLPLPPARPVEDEQGARARTATLVAELAGRPAAPVVLPAGALVDRFGADHGRSLFAAGTPYAERSLPPDLLDPARPDLGLRTFLVLRDVEVVAGTVAPWFGQPGGAVRFDLVGSDDVWVLLRDGVLVPVALADGSPLTPGAG